MNKKRNSGSILIFVAMLTLLAGLLSAALYSTVLSYHRSASEAWDQERALWAAESGVAYYFGQLIGEVNYFNDHPAPLLAMQLNDSTFELESAAEGTSSNQWNIVVVGRFGRGTYRMGAAIGNGLIEFPKGVVVKGTGNPATSVLTTTGTNIIGSYNSDNGAFDPAAPGDNGDAGINGSLNLSAGTTIHGDVSAMGSLLSGLTSSITGNFEAGAAETPIQDIDPIVSNLLASSQTSNNNSVLSGIFGASWIPVSGSQNYGDLIVTSGTYVIPSGTYRFRRFEVKNGARVVFDTQNGPSNLIYVGSGAGTGSLNDLIVYNGGIVEANNGTTTNGLLTVLGPDCDFKVTTNSIFGRSTTDPNSGGYSQVISLGGNSSSDDIMATGNSTVYGRIYAAAHQLTLSSSRWYGSALVRTASITSSTLAVDESSIGGNLVDPSTFSLLAKWRAGS